MVTEIIQNQTYYQKSD